MSEIELSDKDLKGYIAARSFTRAIGDEIVSNIKVDMTEKEVEDVASRIFNKNGVKQHWHMRILIENDIVLIDIAPVYNDYPADYTINHVMGSNPDLEALASYAHDISIKIAEHVKEGRDSNS